MRFNKAEGCNITGLRPDIQNGTYTKLWYVLDKIAIR